MAFIDPIAYEAASGVAAELFEPDRDRLGYASLEPELRDALTVGRPIAQAF